MRRLANWSMAIANAAVVGLVGAALLGAAGCHRGPFAPSKADLLAKAQEAKDRPSLEKALGRPDDVNKFGPIETWTYRARDGELKFTVAGETIVLTRTGDANPAP